MPNGDNIHNPDHPQIEVFVVNYYGGEKLLHCVKSLLGSMYRPFRVRIIDNPPRDPVLDEIIALYPQVDIIEPPSNVGYSGAIHIAAEKCQTDLLIICNNDLLFSTGCIPKLVAVYRQTHAAAVSPRIINPNESHLEANYNATLNPLYFLINGVFADRSRTVYPSGACFMVERKALVECLPPKEFFLYYEDVFTGISLRMSGREMVQANDAVVHHSHGYSVNKLLKYRIAFYRERNRHVCLFVFYSGATIMKLALLIPLTLMHTLWKELMGEASFPGAAMGWAHASLSWSYIRKLRRNLPRQGIGGEAICAGNFTSRLIHDDAPAAATINRLGRWIFRFLRIRTID
jgi:hypothetical protein